MVWNVTPEKDEIGLLMEAGIIYRDSKQFAEATQVFRGVRALLPKSDVPEVGLGTVSFQAGEFEDAARHYERALELNPSSAYAYAHLGELEIFRKNVEKAREHLKQAIELDPRGIFGKLARSLLGFADVVQFKKAV
jgi:Flp pilus assembly protein TadD